MFSAKFFRRKQQRRPPSVTAQPNAQIRFQRALQTGSVTLALGTAAELPQPLALDHALGLTLLFLSSEPHRFPRAAARWAGRYCAELCVELAEAQLLLSLLVALPDQPTIAVRGLEALFMERGERELANTLRRWLVEKQPTR
jgi:hypothetical protein